MNSSIVRCVWLVCAAALILLAVAACGKDSDPPSEPTGRIAFTSDRDGNREIYLINADGSGDKNLTNDPAEDDEPSWSPDGSRIAFSSVRPGQQDIYTMSADGSDVQRFTNSPAVQGNLRWSPDGNKVAFYSFERQFSGFLWALDLESAQGLPLLASIHPAGPEVTCAGGFPGGWLPDSERIVFRGTHADSGAAQICSVKADGTDIQVIYTEPGTTNVNPAVSPDGKKIVFTSDRDGNEEIYMVDADGSDLRRVTNHPASDDYATWSHDGDWIAFASDRDGDFEIFIVRPDGEDVRQLTENASRDFQPAWAP